jgi:hypothetical protein
LVQPDPHQAQRVRVEDVEAAALVHQDLREPRVPDDGVGAEYGPDTNQ